jgi:hypothetical protein
MATRARPDNHAPPRRRQIRPPTSPSTTPGPNQRSGRVLRTGRACGRKDRRAASSLKASPSRRGRRQRQRPGQCCWSSAAVASSVFTTPRWCLGSAHPPAGRTGDDESAVPARERASRHRELRDRPQSSTASVWSTSAETAPLSQEQDCATMRLASGCAQRHALGSRRSGSRASASRVRGRGSGHAR